MNWGTKRRAVFAPRVTDNLRPEAQAIVGQEHEWEYAGVMDEGPYDGQVIWQMTDRSGTRSSAGCLMKTCILPR